MLFVVKGGDQWDLKYKYMIRAGLFAPSLAADSTALQGRLFSIQISNTGIPGIFHIRGPLHR